MGIKAWFKAQTADRVLSPVREEIITQIEDGSSLLDLGCGTGDLLFRAKDKIGFGLGIDLDPAMIKFAENKKRLLNCENLEFVQKDITLYKPAAGYLIDVASSTLCLHELSERDALNTLKLLARISRRVLIADFSNPQSYWSKVSTEIDEILSGHYGRFKAYRQNGYLPYLVNKAGLVVSETIKTPVDGILIWDIRY